MTPQAQKQASLMASAAGTVGSPGTLVGAVAHGVRGQRLRSSYHRFIEGNRVPGCCLLGEAEQPETGSSLDPDLTLKGRNQNLPPVSNKACSSLVSLVPSRACSYGEDTGR